MKKKKKELYADFFRPHLGKLLLAFSITGISTASTFLSTHILSIFVDKISLAESFSTLTILIVIWFTFELISKISAFISSRLLLNAQSKIQHQIKWRIAEKLASASTESVSRSDPVSLSENTSEDVTSFIDSIRGIYQELFSVVLGIAALIYTAMISWHIFVMFIISFSIILVIHFLMMKKMIESQSLARTSSISTKYLLTQIIQAFSDIQLQRLTPGIKLHLSDSMNKETKENLKANTVLINNSLISETVSIISHCVFLLLSATLVHRSKLTIANFVAIYMYRHYIYGLAGTSLRIIKFKAQLHTSKKRMDSIFYYKSVTKEIWGNLHLFNPTGNISIQNVSANYGEKSILNGISVDLPSGNFIGIVGDSGCGKSTLLKVLSKQLPYCGSIKLDGFELSSLDESSLRRAITLAPQQPFLFDFSIKQNMLLSNPSATDDKIWKCLKLSAADKFVLEKGGLDAMLTPKELSGGQKQRLALARLALRGGKIILMDESTSALDGDSQSIVINSVQNTVKKGHTLILVAHRVNTLKSADIILLMENGKIVEKGSYDELYKNSEKFRRLANLG